jgi:hypothetical protein
LIVPKFQLLHQLWWSLVQHVQSQPFHVPSINVNIQIKGAAFQRAHLFSCTSKKYFTRISIEEWDRHYAQFTANMTWHDEKGHSKSKHLKYKTMVRVLYEEKKGIYSTINWVTYLLTSLFQIRKEFPKQTKEMKSQNNEENTKRCCSHAVNSWEQII